MCGVCGTAENNKCIAQLYHLLVAVNLVLAYSLAWYWL